MMRWYRALPALLCLLGAAPAPAEAARRLTLPNELRVVAQSSLSTDIVAIDLLLDVVLLRNPNGSRLVDCSYLPVQ